VIYVDASAILARIFTEARGPADDFWEQELTSSRLLHYEVWNRVHARGCGLSYGYDVEVLLGKIDLIDLLPQYLLRALKPFPLHVRTLDALHLATVDYLQSQRQDVELFSYDKRMLAAAREMGISVYRG
jgi:uncharacterized protein